MMRRAAFGAVVVLLLANAGWAQDADESDEATTQSEEASEPRVRIKVLENPYDIASFYRSRQDRGYFADEQPGFYGGDRYEIARYYRAQPRGRYGYSRFWTSGYGSYQRGRRGRVTIGYRRSIGENGDLFLFAPAILAPVGPLTGAFYDGN